MKDTSDSPKKNLFWQASGKYVLEFFLIFLAVFLGFLAENFREQLGAQSRERAYVVSMVRNLTDDVNRLSELIENNDRKESHLDTALTLRFQALPATEFYKRLNLHVTYGFCCIYLFRSNDATMAQLKNNGGFALLPARVTDSISAYDVSFFRILKEEKQYEQNNLNASQYFTLIGDITPARDGVEQANLTIDWNKNEVRILTNHIVILFYTVQGYTNLLREQKVKAENLIRFLRTEYELE